MPVIWVEIEADYFSREDWTDQISLIRHDKSGFRRTSMEPFQWRALRSP
jgi:hypothetical protein